MSGRTGTDDLQHADDMLVSDLWEQFERRHQLGQADSRSTQVGERLSRRQFRVTQSRYFALVWTCSLRIGALRSIDVDDVDLDDRFLSLHHRPPETSLKNGEKSEREINSHGWVANVIDAWMSDRRPDDRDGGRVPLLTPDSVAPHDVRRSSISCWLDDGHDVELVSQRVDSSPDTLKRKHDVRSEQQKRELRRDAFDM